MMNELIRTLLECIEATERHDKERDQWHGHDWDYFGYDYIVAMEAAQGRFAEVLNNVIDSRVAVAVAKAIQEKGEQNT